MRKQRKVTAFKSNAAGTRLDSLDGKIGIRAKTLDEYLIIIVIRDTKYFCYALDDTGSVVSMVCHNSDSDALRECMKQVEARENIGN